ncbi:MAG: hypothetical protein C4589_04570 [Peptococcaceae bacterium]|nr:MAG: hypothetical protein C4589_04570 [Peptococcaceae bacterium]
MLKKLNFRWMAVLGVLFVVALLTGAGKWSAASQDGKSSVDGLINMHIAEQQKVEQGRKLFKDLLRREGGKAPAYGSDEYLKRLLEYADPAGELRRRDPVKWEFIDAYAYDYYVRNVSPPIPPPMSNTAIDGNQNAVEVAPSDVQIQSGHYNRSGAVNYAYTYVFNYNPAYHKFNADCTNFVSQCLKDGGGVPIVDAKWRPYWDKDDWYYYRIGNDSFDSNNDDAWSWSWVKAKTFHHHINGRPLAVQVSYASQLELGDIVQLNLNDSEPANDHSMIVTKIDPDGTRRVTYHTNNTKDKKLSEIGGTHYYMHVTY